MIEKLTLPASADDLALSVLVSKPETAPRGVFQIVHGMCEHKERYIPFMEWLTQHGFVCVSHDHRGHGASVKEDRDLGYLYEGGWQAMVEDVRVVCDWTQQHFPGLDYTLFGHSMGSMAVRSFAKRYDSRLDRLIVCGSPADNPGKKAGKAIARFYGRFRGWHYRPKLLQKISFGSFNKPFKNEGWPAAWVCSDGETLVEYHKDPLCTYRFTANGFYGLMGLMEDCYSLDGWRVDRPQMPVHFISGAEDPCRGSDEALQQAAELMRRIGYGQVDVRLYPGMRHEILNETDHLTVWNDILNWLG
ncbi:MAG: lysophospholipase [Bacteroidales bacterium]|nr:lysophospholipase [Bacteroidales bacterium]